MLSGRLLDLERRRLRVGRDEGKIDGVGRMGATSSDVDSAISVHPGGVVCCVIQGMT